MDIQLILFLVTAFFLSGIISAIFLREVPGNPLSVLIGCAIACVISAAIVYLTIVVVWLAVAAFLYWLGYSLVKYGG